MRATSSTQAGSSLRPTGKQSASGILGLFANHLFLFFSKPRNETFIVRLGEHILEGVGSYDPDVTGELRLVSIEDKI